MDNIEYFEESHYNIQKTCFFREYLLKIVRFFAHYSLLPATTHKIASLYGLIQIIMVNIKYYYVLVETFTKFL